MDWTNKDDVIQAVSKDPSLLSSAPEWADDKDVVMAAVSKDGDKIRYAAGPVSDIDIASTALKNYADAHGTENAKDLYQFIDENILDDAKTEAGISSDDEPDYVDDDYDEDVRPEVYYDENGMPLENDNGSLFEDSDDVSDFNNADTKNDNADMLETAEAPGGGGPPGPPDDPDNGGGPPPRNPDDPRLDMNQYLQSITAGNFSYAEYKFSDMGEERLRDSFAPTVSIYLEDGEQNCTLRYVPNDYEIKENMVQIKGRVYAEIDSTDKEVLVEKIKNTPQMETAVGMGHTVETIARENHTDYVNFEGKNQTEWNKTTVDSWVKGAVFVDPANNQIEYRVDTIFDDSHIPDIDPNHLYEQTTKIAVGGFNGVLLSNNENELETGVKDSVEAFAPLADDDSDKVDKGFERLATGLTGRNAQTMEVVARSGFRDTTKYPFEFHEKHNDGTTTTTSNFKSVDNNGNVLNVRMFGQDTTEKDDRRIFLMECRDEKNDRTGHFLIDNNMNVRMPLDDNRMFGTGDKIQLVTESGAEVHTYTQPDKTGAKEDTAFEKVCHAIDANISKYWDGYTFAAEKSGLGQIGTKIQNMMEMTKNILAGDAETKDIKEIEPVVKAFDVIETEIRSIASYRSSVSSQEDLFGKTMAVKSSCWKLGNIEKYASNSDDIYRLPAVQVMEDYIGKAIDAYNERHPDMKLHIDKTIGTVYNDAGFTSEGDYIEKYNCLEGYKPSRQEMKMDTLESRGYRVDYEKAGFDTFTSEVTEGRDSKEVESEFLHLLNITPRHAYDYAIDEIKDIAPTITADFLKEHPDARPSLIDEVKRAQNIERLYSKDSTQYINGMKAIAEECANIFVKYTFGDIQNVDKDESGSVENGIKHYFDDAVINQKANDYMTYKLTYPIGFQNNFFVQFKQLQLMISAKKAGITVKEFNQIDRGIPINREREKKNPEIADRAISAGDIAVQIFRLTQCNLTEAMIEKFIVWVIRSIASAIEKHRADKVDKDDNKLSQGGVTAEEPQEAGVDKTDGNDGKEPKEKEKPEVENNKPNDDTKPEEKEKPEVENNKPNDDTKPEEKEKPEVENNKPNDDTKPEEKEKPEVENNKPNDDTKPEEKEKPEVENNKPNDDTKPEEKEKPEVENNKPNDDTKPEEKEKPEVENNKPNDDTKPKEKEKPEVENNKPNDDTKPEEKEKPEVENNKPNDDTKPEEKEKPEVENNKPNDDTKPEEKEKPEVENNKPNDDTKPEGQNVDNKGSNDGKESEAKEKPDVVNKDGNDDTKPEWQNVDNKDTNHLDTENEKDKKTDAITDDSDKRTDRSTNDDKTNDDSTTLETDKKDTEKTGQESSSTDKTETGKQSDTTDPTGNATNDNNISDTNKEPEKTTTPEANDNGTDNTTTPDGKQPETDNNSNDKVTSSEEKNKTSETTNDIEKPETSHNEQEKQPSATDDIPSNLTEMMKQGIETSNNANQEASGIDNTSTADFEGPEVVVIDLNPDAPQKEVQTYISQNDGTMTTDDLSAFNQLGYGEQVDVLKDVAQNIGTGNGDTMRSNGDIQDQIDHLANLIAKTDMSGDGNLNDTFDAVRDNLPEDLKMNLDFAMNDITSGIIAAADTSDVFIQMDDKIYQLSPSDANPDMVNVTVMDTDFNVIEEPVLNNIQDALEQAVNDIDAGLVNDITTFDDLADRINDIDTLQDKLDTNIDNDFADIPGTQEGMISLSDNEIQATLQGIIDNAQQSDVDNSYQDDWSNANIDDEAVIIE